MAKTPLTSSQYNARLVFILFLAIIITFTLRSALRRTLPEPTHAAISPPLTPTATPASLRSCLPSPLPPLTLQTLHDGEVTLFPPPSSPISPFTFTPAYPPPYLLLFYTPFTPLSTSLFSLLPSLLPSLPSPLTLLLLSYGHSTLSDPTLGASHLKDIYALDTTLPPHPSLHLIRSHPLCPSPPFTPHPPSSLPPSSPFWLSSLLECPLAPHHPLPLLTLLNFNRTIDHLPFHSPFHPYLPSLTSLPPHSPFRLHYIEAPSRSCPPGTPPSPFDPPSSLPSNFSPHPPSSPFLVLTPMGGGCGWWEKAAEAERMGAAGLLLHPREKEGKGWRLSCEGEGEGCERVGVGKGRGGGGVAVPTAMVDYDDAYLLQDMSLDVVDLTVRVGTHRVGLTALALNADGSGGWWDEGERDKEGGREEVEEVLRRAAGVGGGEGEGGVRWVVVWLSLFSLAVAAAVAARLLWRRATAVVGRRPTGLQVGPSHSRSPNPNGGQRKAWEGVRGSRVGHGGEEEEEEGEDATRLLLSAQKDGHR